jgi:hypothetical protein
MERNTILFIVVKALHVSGGFNAHHQEPEKLYIQRLVFVMLNSCYR